MKAVITLALATLSLSAVAQDIGALTAETGKTVLPVLPKVVGYEPGQIRGILSVERPL